MKYTYRITSLLAIVAWHEIVKAAFPYFDGQETSFDGYGVITVTFDTPQTPADLGPLVRVELISE